jgi:hypothetical protein
MPRCTDAGFQDDINDLLDSLIDGPGYLKEQNVPLTERFCEAFMKKYTDVPTFDAFLSLGGFTARSRRTIWTLFPTPSWINWRQSIRNLIPG